MKESSKDLLSLLGGIVAIPLLASLMVFANGFMVYKITAWFMPMLYEGWVGLTFTQSIAVSFFIALLGSNGKPKDGFKEALYNKAVSYFAFLGIAWVTYLIIG